MRITASDASGKTAPSTGSVFVQLHLMRENDPTAKGAGVQPVCGNHRVAERQIEGAWLWLSHHLWIHASEAESQGSHRAAVQHADTACVLHTLASALSRLQSLPFMKVTCIHMPCSPASSAASFTKSCSWLHARHLRQCTVCGAQGHHMDCICVSRSTHA